MSTVQTSTRQDDEVEANCHLSSLLIRVSIYIVTILGFGYQVGFISKDYFSYPTFTTVSMKDALPITIPPKVTFRIPYGARHFSRMKTIGEYFDRVKDSTRVTECRFRTNSSVIRRNDSHVRVEPFFRDGKYYLSFIPRNRIEFTPEQLYDNDERLYDFAVRTNQLISSSKSTFKDTLFVNFPIFMSSYYSDMQGLLKTPTRLSCSKKHEYCRIETMYSVKVTQLVPPPYDTDCRDYRLSNFTSRQNCFSQCLMQFTQKYGWIIQSTVTLREEYRNSSLSFLPKMFWTLVSEEGPLTVDTLKTLKRQRDMNHAKNISLPSNDYIDKAIEILPSYLKHWRKCRTSCGRKDCYTEDVVPKLLGGNFLVNNSKALRRPIYKLGVFIFPPNDQIIIVTSRGRISLVDLFVYFFSCLAFWFGFCPLALANGRFSPKWKTGKNSDRHTRHRSRSRVEERITQKWKVRMERVKKPGPYSCFMRNYRKINVMSRHEDAINTKNPTRHTSDIPTLVQPL